VAAVCFYNGETVFSFLIAHWRWIWLIVASLLAGILNAMAGGGSFLSFPAMMGIGVPPIEANATNTVALWPGQVTSLTALHGDLRKDLLPTVLLTSVVGGILGAEVLLNTPQRTFIHLIPWLLLVGAVIFGISGPMSKWLRGRAKGEAPAEVKIHWLALSASLLPICFYVGYFGAGGGFLVMTVLALFGIEDMHQLNALKIVVACASNFCAVVTFIVNGRVIWHDCLVAMVAAGLGGVIGARWAKRMNPDVLRVVIVTTGVTIAGYFFWRQA
jgi:uncharacterized membrane protein YfcA